MQVWTKDKALDFLQYAFFPGGDGLTPMRLDGASMIGTLRKAWGLDAPPLVGWLVVHLMLWAQQPETEHRDATVSAALGVAHLLPTVIGCGLPSAASIPKHNLHLCSDSGLSVSAADFTVAPYEKVFNFLSESILIHIAFGGHGIAQPLAFIGTILASDLLKLYISTLIEL